MSESLWVGAYKIPWQDPAFSRRMLAEHLSQEHDLASRRTEWIERQVDWIHNDLLGARSVRLLDLGCGPGFYALRLTQLGHQVHGIDFGPASIEYANRHNPDPSRCTFMLGDIRTADFGGPYDLATMLYGELNVFSPEELAGVLRRVHDCLAPGGRFITEVQVAEAVKKSGLAGPTEQSYEAGLFSDRPHRLRTENRWHPDERAAVQTFHVTSQDEGHVQTYRSTTKAWSEEELIALLTEAGFTQPMPRPDWPCNTTDLRLWTATRT